jgi:DNA polymerase elongation subunit (family B)
MEKDFVAYIDTDSLFVMLGSWIENNLINPDDWKQLSDEKKIDIIKKISRVIEDEVNEKIFENVQIRDYNSQVHDFKIGFKQEIIAKNALFVKKKKYAFWCVDEEGIPTDKMEVTGLEIVRSDSSEAIRERLKHIMEMIIKGFPDDEIINIIDNYKKELMKVYPEEIAANISVNNINKYVVNGISQKGAPWHIKGVNNYRKLLKELNIQDHYEDISEGIKVKVVYLKKNQFNFETVSFIRWPKEFDKVVSVDKSMMIEKFFIKKIRSLLEPINKKDLLANKSAEKGLNVFFN